MTDSEKQELDELYIKLTEGKYSDTTLADWTRFRELHTQYLKERRGRRISAVKDFLSKRYAKAKIKCYHSAYKGSKGQDLTRLDIELARFGDTTPYDVDELRHELFVILREKDLAVDDIAINRKALFSRPGGAVLDLRTGRTRPRF